MRCNIHTTAGCVYAFCCGKNGEGRRELAKNVVLVVWHGGLILRDERRLLGVLEVRQWSEADDRGGGERGCGREWEAEKNIEFGMRGCESMNRTCSLHAVYLCNQVLCISL